MLVEPLRGREPEHLIDLRVIDISLVPEVEEGRVECFSI
jgi:hypothetical protein